MGVPFALVLGTHTKKGHHEGGLSRYGAPERIRTSDTRLRKPVLYPAELRALIALHQGG